MTSRWQRKPALSGRGGRRLVGWPGFLSAVLLAPPTLCWADASAAVSSAIDGTDVLTGHGFNLLLYFPVGLIAAAILLEWFAQWKGNRDVEPGILFLLFSAGGAAVVTALLALAFATVGRQTGQLSAFCTWMVVVAGFAGLAFFLKRKCRDRKLFALRPPPNLSGRVVVPRTSTQKGLIVGYRVALVFALLIAMIGVSEMPVGNVPLKSLASAIRSITQPSAAPAGTVAVGAVRPDEVPPVTTPATPATPATPDVPKLADLIGQRSTTTPAPGEREANSLIAAATASIDGQPAIVASPSTTEAPAVAATSPPTPPPEAPSATPPPETAPPTTPPSGTPAMTPPATTPTVASTTGQPRPALDKTFFTTRIKPILDSKCTSCHGSSKQKADLRLDSVAAIRKGSDHPIIVPGNPDASEIYSRLTATDEDEMMPPKEKSGPLPAAQIELFKTWILAGADFGDGSASAAASLPAQSGGQTEEALSQKLPPPDPALLARLSQAGVVIRPVSSNGALLDINFSHTELPQINLAELAPIAKNIYALDLTRTKIRDDALAPLAQMTNLRRLQLNRNPITDAALAHLKNLTALESLNLYETGVTDAGLDQLSGLKKLQKLYLFNTKCTAAGADKLKAQIPGIEINLGG